MSAASAAADPGAAPYVPDTVDLDALARAANGCQGCPLFSDATRAVFGEGERSASLMLVGEQPGDHEDREGHPFVGPAGRVLWDCIADAGIDHDAVFVTNAVKHFKHETRGKRRIHQRPTAGEIDACHPWLEAELHAVPARVVLALGATAVRGLLGRPLPIAANRGRSFPLGDRTVRVTYHPSAVLRGEDRAAEIRAALVEDLRAACAAGPGCRVPGPAEAVVVRRERPPRSCRPRARRWSRSRPTRRS